MNNRLLIRCIFTYACLLGLLSCNHHKCSVGHDFEVDGIYYRIADTDSNKIIVTYKGNSSEAYEDEYSGSVIIPSNLTYKNKNYTITEIGNHAFSKCSKMTSITIPSSVEFIGLGAFSGCYGLKEIHISNLSSWCKFSFGDILDDIGESLFLYANKLYLNGELITDLIIPEDVTEIGAHAFEGYDNLKSVTLHNGIKTIHKSAFLNCSNLTDINFSDSINYIGPYAFNGTSWYENMPDGEVYIGKLLYNYKGDMASNTSIIIKEGTETICPSAFDGYTELTKITLPSSLKDVHDYAFSGCSNLKEIYCKALTPPSINSYYNNFHDDVVIYVPKGTQEAYKEDNRLFENVVEIDFMNKNSK